MEPKFNFQNTKPVAVVAPTVSTKLEFTDYLGAIKVRWDIGRNNYRVNPGLYKVGKPNNQSDVLVSCNYKLSFDHLRKNLSGLNAWILVIDTKGVNVWCSAGKGTFGTLNLVKSIRENALDLMVSHRKIIVPQLAATGVAAHKVMELSGFSVIFGPVRASDIKPFIEAGYKATSPMRKMDFPFGERAKLIPVDLMYRKYALLGILIGIFFLSGLDKTGFLFSKMAGTCMCPLINILGAYVAGIVLAPLFLPWTPFRSFSMKGAFWGTVITLLIGLGFKTPLLEWITFLMINLSISSFMMMNFTGSSTFTSLSGVQKEMKVAVPLQLIFALLGIALFIVFKLLQP
ncbi:MAG TPA: mercury methylation corrinoid protein HgcA [Prolixibacteraceae bacterium]|nr:mercury methylation corrinoid protein HgcA [Prolixibacteraceae bacterium]